MMTHRVSFRRTFLIAPAARTTDVSQAIGSIRQITVRQPGRPAAAVTPLFTERERGLRVVARLPDGATLRLVGVRGPATLSVLLGHLMAAGESHLLIDPAPPTHPGLLVTIRSVLRAIRRRRKDRPPHPEL